MNTLQLTQLDTLPEGILSATPASLHKILPGPTLLHLAGKQPAPLFISILLHGNEPTGFHALQRLLKKYQDKQLPRSLSIFFGNIEAAAQGLRRLNGQPDYNRVWPGTEFPESPETRLTREIVAIMQRRQVFASIDIHNNTGLNPHYACINKLDHQFLQLASLFGRMIVYFIHPKGVQSAAFAELCPAVTLECGRPGQEHGVDHALEYLDGCLHLTELRDHCVAAQDMDVYHTVAQVGIRDGVTFSFTDPQADLLLDQDLERMNFTEIPAGTPLGKINGDGKLPILARDDHGRDITEQFFSIEDDELCVKRKTMPSMLTLDERVIRQDCLCYLMERIQP